MRIGVTGSILTVTHGDDVKCLFFPVCHLMFLVVHA